MEANLATIDNTSMLSLLEKRFKDTPQWQDNLEWKTVVKKLEANPASMDIIKNMEATDGMPHIVGLCKETKGILIYECVAESPKTRRSLCYDAQAWDERKEHKPTGNVIDAAASIGGTLMDETHYRHLQSLGNFDLKTSSWLATPAAIRKLGGAIFGDKRYNQVFIYHNGASSYYASRGFRLFHILK